MSLIYGQRPDFDKKCLDAIFSGFGDLPLDKVISNIQHTIDGIESDIESAKKIDLDIQTEKATATANSGGVINLKGTTFSFDAIVKSGSIVKAYELNSSQTKVKASSGGSCKAYARDIFEANASLGGSIEVYGDPKTFNQVISLGGSIIETNND